MSSLGIIAKSITRAKTVAIFSHINPDGDSIGSLLSLGLGIKALGKKVYMVSSDGVPKRYRGLPAARKIIRKLRKKVDLAIAVDCGHSELLGKNIGAFYKARQTLVIDHHDFVKPFSRLSFVDKKAAAVGELVFKLLKVLKIKIPKDIAQNILTSIIVETNSFRLPNVRQNTFSVCSELAKAKIDFYKLSEMVYWAKSKESIILSGICFSRCKFLKTGKIVWSIAWKKDFTFSKAKSEDADTIATDLLSIKEAKIAIFFREEKKNRLRVSLRSKGKVNVAAIAAFYGGGGHFDAAGCHIDNKPELIEGILNLAKKAIVG